MPADILTPDSAAAAQAPSEASPSEAPKGWFAKFTDALAGRKSAEAAAASALADRDQALADLMSASEKITILTGERDTALAQLADSQAAAAALRAERDSLQAAAATAEEVGGKIAADVLARHGGVAEPENLPAADSSDPSPTKTLAEFNKMTLGERAAFMRTGGKISD